MKSIAQVSLAVGVIVLLIGVYAGIAHVEISGIPPESFARGASNLFLLAIALLLLDRR